MKKIFIYIGIISIILNCQTPQEKLAYAAGGCNLEEFKQIKAEDMYDVGIFGNVFMTIKENYILEPEKCNKVIDYLLREKKFDLTKESGDLKTTALDTDFTNMNVNMLKQIVKSGGNINATTEKNCYTLLHRAAMKTNIELFPVGDLKNEYIKNTEVIKFLIQNESDTQKKCSGLTAYELAKSNNYLRTMKVFEDLGVKK